MEEFNTGYIRGILLINNLNHSGNYSYHPITVSLRNSAFWHIYRMILKTMEDYLKTTNQLVFVMYKDCVLCD